MATLYEIARTEAVKRINDELEGYRRAWDELARIETMQADLDVEAPEGTTCNTFLFTAFTIPFNHQTNDVVLLELLARGCRGEMPTITLEAENKYNLGYYASLWSTNGTGFSLSCRPTNTGSNCHLKVIGEREEVKKVPMYKVVCGDSAAE